MSANLRVIVRPSGCAWKSVDPFIILGLSSDASLDNAHELTAVEIDADLADARAKMA